MREELVCERGRVKVHTPLVEMNTAAEVAEGVCD